MGHCEEIELKVDLDRAIGRISSHSQRLVINLSLGGYSDQDISIVTGRSVQNVGQIRRRAYAFIHAQLRDYFQEGRGW